jgi:FkbM family methyltransferase
MIDIFETLYRKLIRRIIDIRELKNIVKSILKKLGLYFVIKWKIVKFTRKRINPPEKVPSEFSQYINKGDLCFDIGAWEGQFIEILLRWGARVIAIEPQIDCIEKLNVIYSKNKGVKVFWNAVGEQEGEGEISICSESTQCSTLSNRFREESRFTSTHKWTSTQKISIITLDSLIKAFGIPKFCKIDVEGYELRVIKGLSVRIPYISFEFHRELIDIAKKCCNQLLSIGNVKFNCVFHEFPLKFHFPDWVNINQLYRVIDSHENKLLA